MRDSRKERVGGGEAESFIPLVRSPTPLPISHALSPSPIRPLFGRHPGIFGADLCIHPGVQRQRLWDQIGDLNNGGFLAHRNPKESEDEPEILRPTHAGTSRKAGPRYSYPSGEPHLPFQVKPLSSVLMDDLKVAHKYGDNDGA